MITDYLSSIEYDRGYTKALYDMKEWFRMHSQTLKYNKLYNAKGINALISAMIENSDTFKKFADLTEFKVKRDIKNNPFIEIGENEV